MFTVFTDGAALLRLVHGIDTLWDGTVGHHAVHLIIWFAAAPLTGGRLWREGGGHRNRGSRLVHSVGFTCMSVYHMTGQLKRKPALFVDVFTFPSCPVCLHG